MNSPSTKKGISIFKVWGIVISIIVISIIIAIAYTSFRNKILLNETYESEIIDNNLSAKDFFTEYNTQLETLSIPIIKDSKIKYKKTNDISYQIAELSNLTIDDYHVYASWKPEAKKSLPNSKVYMKIDFYSQAIDYQNFCQGYISENYDIAILKSMRNILINNGYECISEEEIINFYYSILTNESVYGKLNPIRVCEEFSIIVSYNRYAITISLYLNTDH